MPRKAQAAARGKTGGKDAEDSASNTRIEAEEADRAEERDDVATGAASDDASDNSDSNSNSDSDASDDDNDDSGEQSDAEGDAPADASVPAPSRAVASDSLMAYFWEIVSLDEQHRLDSSQALLSLLLKSQHAHEAASDTPDGTFSADVDYSINRLIRGVGSGRKAARQGFTVVLTELLRLIPTVTPMRVIEQINKFLVPNMSAKTVEQRDVFYGRLFAFASLVRSGCLFRFQAVHGDEEETKSSSTAVAHPLNVSQADLSESVRFVATSLLQVVKFKSYVRVPASHVICDLISMAPPEVFLRDILPVFSSLILNVKSQFEADADANAQGVASQNEHNKARGASSSKKGKRASGDDDDESASDGDSDAESDGASDASDSEEDGEDSSFDQKSSTGAGLTKTARSDYLATLGTAMLFCAAPHLEYALAEGSAVALPEPITHEHIQQRLALISFADDTGSEDMDDAFDVNDMSDAKAFPQQLASALVDASTEHAVWDYFALHVSKLTPSQFSFVWNSFVEKILFVPDRTTHRRKLAGFMFFMKLLSVSDDKIGMAFTKRFCSCLITNLADKTTHLHAIASETVKALVEHAKKPDVSAGVRLSIISGLTGVNGSRKFDSLTKTQTVHTIIQSLTLDEVTSYIASLQEGFINPPLDAGPSSADADGEGEGEAGDAEERMSPEDAYRLFVLEQLLSVYRTPLHLRTEAWAMGSALFLMAYGFFDLSDAETAKIIGKKLKDVDHVTVAQLSSPLSGRIRNLAISRFVSVLNDLSAKGPFETSEESASSGKSRQYNRAHVGFDAEGNLRIGVLVEFLQTFMAKNALLSVPLDEDNGAAFVELMNLKDTIEKDCPTTKKAAKRARRRSSTRASAKAVQAITRPTVAQQIAQSFLLLILHTSILVLQNKEGMADVIPDLRESYVRIQAKIAESSDEDDGSTASKRAKKAAKPTSKKGGKKDPVADNDAEDEAVPEAADLDPSQVLVDILLSYLAQPSAVLRTVVDQVFSSLSSVVSFGALSLLLDVLTASKAFSNNILEVVDEDGMDDNTDESDEDEDDDAANAHSDADAKDGEESDSMDESDDDDVAGDNDSDDDNDDDDEDVDVEFRQKVANALQIETNEQGDVIEDDDDESGDSDNDWTDEQMFRIDDALAAAFRERLKTRPSKKKTRTEAAHFKLRVLDLVFLYVKNEPTNPIIISIIPQLIKAFIATNMLKEQGRMLQDRLLGFFRNRLHSMKTVPHVSSDNEIKRAHQILAHCISKGSKVKDAGLRHVAVGSVKFLLRVLTHGETAPVEGADGVLRIGQLSVDKFTELFSTEIKKFLTATASEFNPLLLNTVAEKYPYLGWCLMHPLGEHASEATKSFRLQACTEFLLRLLQKKKFIEKHSDAVEKASKSCVSLLSTVFESIQGGESAKKVKPKFVKTFFQALRLLTKHLHEADGVRQFSEKAAQWGATESRSTAVRSLCSQILVGYGHEKLASKKEQQKKEKKDAKKGGNRAKNKAAPEVAAAKAGGQKMNGKRTSHEARREGTKSPAGKAKKAKKLGKNVTPAATKPQQGNQQRQGAGNKKKKAQAKRKNTGKR